MSLESSDSFKNEGEIKTFLDESKLGKIPSKNIIYVKVEARSHADCAQDLAEVVGVRTIMDACSCVLFFQQRITRRI